MATQYTPQVQTDIATKQTSRRATRPPSSRNFRNVLGSVFNNTAMAVARGVDAATGFGIGGGIATASVRAMKGGSSGSLGTTSSLYSSSRSTVTKSGDGDDGTFDTSGIGNDVDGTDGDPFIDGFANARDLLREQARLQNQQIQITAETNILRAEHEGRRSVVRNYNA